MAVKYLQEQPSPQLMRYRQAQNTPCSGDLVDVFASSGQRANVVIADVCGRDARAHEHAQYLRSVVRALAQVHSPAGVLQRANLAFCRYAAGHDDSRFASLFMATLDEERLTFASAGHDFAILMSPDGQHCHLQPTGTIIGISEIERYQDRMLAVGSGDWLILVTDGITDARDAGGAFFGTSGVARSACSAIRAGLDDPASRILDDARDHVGGRLIDDASVLCVRFS